MLLDKLPIVEIPVPGATASIADMVRVAKGEARLALGSEVRRTIANSHQRLKRAIDERRHVYGVTTGFGPLANRLIDAGDGAALQMGLVMHLATGVGPPFSCTEARMIVLARLLSISRGFSGASEALCDLMLALLNSGFAPIVPSRGTVGASGDLTPLAHVALALMGREDFINSGGETVNSAHVFEALGQTPFELAARDGLALVNGTSAMTAIAALSSERATRLITWGEALSVGVAELLGGHAEAWHPAFSRARPHPGQETTASVLRERIAGGSRMRLDFTSERCLPDLGSSVVEELPPQDAYTIRCVPQILGSVRDALAYHDLVVTRELNASTDNPIFPEGEVAALHGGNFMGQHVAHAADGLAMAMVSAAGLAERQLARLTDERLNRGLPAFLHRGPSGLNSGFMGAQVTATSLLAEMRTHAVPASIQSISTNGANQDVVSMGTIAARNCASQLDLTAQIIAILALAVAQGVDIVRARGEGEDFSESTLTLCEAVRRLSAPLEEDRALAPDIERVAAWIETVPPPEPAGFNGPEGS